MCYRIAGNFCEVQIFAIFAIFVTQYQNILENVEHCGGEPEQADTGYYVTDE